MKNENFGILVIFQSFCVRINISQGFIWVAFHSGSRAHFSAFHSSLPLSISQKNVKNSVKVENFFGFQSNFSVFSQIFSTQSVYFKNGEVY